MVLAIAMAIVGSFCEWRVMDECSGFPRQISSLDHGPEPTATCLRSQALAMRVKPLGPTSNRKVQGSQDNGDAWRRLEHEWSTFFGWSPERTPPMSSQNDMQQTFLEDPVPDSLDVMDNP